MENVKEFINSAEIPNIGCSPLFYVMQKYLKRVPIDDSLWLEFGVYSGTTIKFISKFSRRRIIYGFDSFEGLPENWRDEYGKGSFNLNGNMPIVPRNVRLIKGFFQDSLPKFMEENANRGISFIHMDCDLYSSTKFVLDTVKNNIKPGCIIVFDEMINYDGCTNEKGELRAWVEFVKENSVEFEFIGMNGKIGDVGKIHEEVAIKITKIGE